MPRSPNRPLLSRFIAAFVGLFLHHGIPCLFGTMPQLRDIGMVNGFDKNKRYLMETLRNQMKPFDNKQY